MTLALASRYSHHFSIPVTSTDPHKLPGSRESLRSGSSVTATDMSSEKRLDGSSAPSEHPNDAQNHPSGTPNFPYSAYNAYNAYNAGNAPYNQAPSVQQGLEHYDQNQQARFGQWAQYQQQWAQYQQQWPHYQQQWSQYNPNMAYGGATQTPMQGQDSNYRAYADDLQAPVSAQYDQHTDPVKADRTSMSVQHDQLTTHTDDLRAPISGPQSHLNPSALGFRGKLSPSQQANADIIEAGQYDNSSSKRPKRSRANPKARARSSKALNGAPQLHDKYDILSRVRSYDSRSSRVDKPHRASVVQVSRNLQQQQDTKIMLPAPQPSDRYMLQAYNKAEVIDPPSLKLVILDLNGTLIYRPDRRTHPTKMIGRPMLAQFLHYLFDNFAVMVWSSATPANVTTLVEIGLGDYKSRLVDVWARDKFGLAPHHYKQNVQCYKDLTRVWASAEVQRSKPGHATGKSFDQRNMSGHQTGKIFDQRNTILIDDSAVKASAQPYNLVEIPEFVGVTDETNQQDILGEVAGYLELLKMQEDVSKFIHKTPFKANGTWSFDWKHLTPKDEQSDSIEVDKASEAQLEPVVLGV